MPNIPGSRLGQGVPGGLAGLSGITGGGGSGIPGMPSAGRIPTLSSGSLSSIPTMSSPPSVAPQQSALRPVSDKAYGLASAMAILDKVRAGQIEPYKARKMLKD